MSQSFLVTNEVTRQEKRNEQETETHFENLHKCHFSQKHGGTTKNKKLIEFSFSKKDRVEERERGSERYFMTICQRVKP